MSELGKHAAGDAVFTSKAALAIGASAIPLLGGPIATAIGIWEGERISRRVEALVEDIRDRIAAIDAAKLDSDYVRSEAFQDVAISALQAAKRSSAAGKRVWIAAVLSGAATTDRPPDLDAEALLDTLGELTERELLVLRWMWTHKGTDGRIHSAAVPSQLQSQDFNFHLRRLESAGLIAFEANRPFTGSYDWRIFAFTGDPEASDVRH